MWLLHKIKRYDGLNAQLVAKHFYFWYQGRAKAIIVLNKSWHNDSYWLVCHQMCRRESVYTKRRKSTASAFHYLFEVKFLIKGRECTGCAWYDACGRRVERGNILFVACLRVANINALCCRCSLQHTTDAQSAFQNLRCFEICNYCVSFPTDFKQKCCWHCNCTVLHLVRSPIWMKHSNFPKFSK